MSKRKRLSPPMAMLVSAPVPEGADPVAPSPLGSGPRRRSAPIADVAAESAAVAALEEVSRSMEAAREEGRMVLSVPLESIVTDHLARDRIAAEGEDMQSLRDSLRARGQQTPIEVMRLEGGRYGLISGWRRCLALRQLFEEASDERFATVLVLLRRPEQTQDAYLAMVEENEIRADLSHYERARIVVKAVEQGVFVDDRSALRGLFGAASRSKRSKIGSFLSVVRALDSTLRHPQALGERLGLALAKALEMPGTTERLVEALEAQACDSAETEQSVLQGALTAQVSGSEPKLRSEGREGAQEIAKGVWLRQGRGGVLTLEGLNDDLRGRMVAWLRAELG